MLLKGYHGVEVTGNRQVDRLSQGARRKVCGYAPTARRSGRFQVNASTGTGFCFPIRRQGCHNEFSERHYLRDESRDWPATPPFPRRGGRTPIWVERDHLAGRMNWSDRRGQSATNTAVVYMPGAEPGTSFHARMSGHGPPHLKTGADRAVHVIFAC